MGGPGAPRLLQPCIQTEGKTQGDTGWDWAAQLRTTYAIGAGVFCHGACGPGWLAPRWHKWLLLGGPQSGQLQTGQAHGGAGGRGGTPNNVIGGAEAKVLPFGGRGASPHAGGGRGTPYRALRIWGAGTCPSFAFLPPGGQGREGGGGGTGGGRGGGGRDRPKKLQLFKGPGINDWDLVQTGGKKGRGGAARSLSGPGGGTTGGARVKNRPVHFENSPFISADTVSAAHTKRGTTRRPAFLKGRIFGPQTGAFGGKGQVCGPNCFFQGDSGSDLPGRGGQVCSPSRWGTVGKQPLGLDSVGRESYPGNNTKRGGVEPLFSFCGPFDSSVPWNCRQPSFLRSGRFARRGLVGTPPGVFPLSAGLWGQNPPLGRRGHPHSTG